MNEAKDRLRDFTERSRLAPEGLRVQQGLGRYIPINPTSDESELLERLDLEASSCVKVDLYWERKADVIFVQIVSEAYFSDRKHGYYARSAPSGYLNIVAVVAASEISSSVVSSVLSAVDSHLPDEKGLGPELVRLPINIR